MGQFTLTASSKIMNWSKHVGKNIVNSTCVKYVVYFDNSIA